jgi:ketosteroid isomerase-like protein
MGDDTVTVALDAMERFRSGWASGSWKPFIELLSSDFEMRVPVGELRGRVVGREEAATHFQKLRLMRVRLTVGEPTRTTVGDGTVMFEVQVNGTLYGLPYRNNLAFAFDVRDGKVCGLREYFGDLDRDILAKALE